MSEVAELWRRANDIVAILEKWIEENDHKSLRLTITRENQMRLLKLRTWTFRYYLSIPEILDLIMPVLRGRVKRTKPGYGLGIAVRSLVGKGAEGILQVEIARRFKSNEHIQVWKEEQRELQLELEFLEQTEGVAVRQDKLVTIQNADNADQFVAAYTKQIEARRKTAQSEGSNKERRRKRYRRSPWF